MNALKAKEFYRRDVQYIVRDGKALIINEVFLIFCDIMIYLNSNCYFLMPNTVICLKHLLHSEFVIIHIKMLFARGYCWI